MDFTRKNLIRIFLPLLAQQLIMNLLTVIDSFMVGGLGDEFISAITIVNKVFSISSSMLIGLVASCSVFIAQFHGANDSSNMGKTTKLCLCATMVILCPMIIGGIVFPTEICMLFTKSSDILRPASLYMRFVSISFIPYIFSQCISNIVRSIGYVKGTLYANISVIVIKIMLNTLLLYNPWKLGVQGAGIALVITRLIEFALLAYVFAGIREMPKIKEILRTNIDFSLLKRVMKRMIPLGVNELLYGIALALIYKMYALYDAQSLAGYSIAITYFDLFRVAFSSVGMIMNIYVLPVLSLSNFSEAKRRAKGVFIFGVQVSVLLGILLGSLSLTVPWIYDSSPVAIKYAQQLLITMGILYPFTMTHSLYYFVFRCGQDNKSILMVDSLFLLLVILPLQYLFISILHFNLYTTYIVLESVYVVKCILAMLLLKKERWLRTLVEE